MYLVKVKWTIDSIENHIYNMDMDGGMEGWRDGGMEGWRDGGMEG